MCFEIEVSAGFRGAEDLTASVERIVNLRDKRQESGESLSAVFVYVCHEMYVKWNWSDEIDLLESTCLRSPLFNTSDIGQPA